MGSDGHERRAHGHDAAPRFWGDDRFGGGRGRVRVFFLTMRFGMLGKRKHCRLDGDFFFSGEGG